MKSLSIKTRKFADDGWGIWIDGDDRSTVYLNEWINPKGKSYVDINKSTGASTATICRVSRCLNYGSGGYKTVIGRLEENK